MQLNLNERMTMERLEYFAETLKQIQTKIDFRVSARGWCYQLEVLGVIDKGGFDKVETWINRARKEGFLPIDFVAEESARQFSNVEKPEDIHPVEYMRRWIVALRQCENYYVPDWWDGEKYYIQMIVEKIDLKTLFEGVCSEYHIPIATSRGWSSILQRAEYARRFQEAEERGLQCVLLYAGDFDPDGHLISNRLMENLDDIRFSVWQDGTPGYDPENLIIERFGLNFDFILEHNLSWINNLKTGSNGEIAVMREGRISQGRTNTGKPHPNFYLDYVQDYLRQYGVRKCEANAIVTIPDIAREFCRGIIETYLGKDSKERFAEKMKRVAEIIDDFREEKGINQAINEALEAIDNREFEEGE